MTETTIILAAVGGTLVAVLALLAAGVWVGGQLREDEVLELQAQLKEALAKAAALERDMERHASAYDRLHDLLENDTKVREALARGDARAVRRLLLGGGTGGVDDPPPAVAGGPEGGPPRA